MLTSTQIFYLMIDRCGFDPGFATDCIQVHDTRKSLRRLETEIIEEAIAARSELIDSLDKSPESLRPATQAAIDKINELLRGNRK